MEVIINTDNVVEGKQDFKNYYAEELKVAMKRFDQYITRFEVYFSDENSGEKHSPKDKMCVIEARMRGKNPERVSNRDSENKKAFDGAVKKMRVVLERTIDKMQTHH